MCFDRIGLIKKSVPVCEISKIYKTQADFFCRFNSYYVTGLFLVNTELSIL